MVIFHSYVSLPEGNHQQLGMSNPSPLHQLTPPAPGDGQQRWRGRGQGALEAHASGLTGLAMEPWRVFLNGGLKIIWVFHWLSLHHPPVITMNF